jgi:hypothetical protein
MNDDAIQYAYSVPFEQLPELQEKAKVALAHNDSEWNRAVAEAIEGRFRAIAGLERVLHR